MPLSTQISPHSNSSLGGLKNIHWKDCCWSWNSSTLATGCEELTHWKRPWCGEGVGAGGEGDDRGWDGWVASLTQWTWVWVNSGSWWWTGRPRVLLSMGLQRVGHDWVTELNWLNFDILLNFSLVSKAKLNTPHLLQKVLILKSNLLPYPNHAVFLEIMLQLG